jgi:hypothetical protein
MTRFFYHTSADHIEVEAESGAELTREEATTLSLVKIANYVQKLADDHEQIRHKLDDIKLSIEGILSNLDGQ